MVSVMIGLAFLAVIVLQVVLLALFVRSRRAGQRLQQRLDQGLNQGQGRHKELAGLLDKTRSELKELRRSTRRQIVDSALDSTRQTQATLNLFSMVQVDRELPAMGGWAASPDVLLHLVENLVERRPSCIVECGSGTSTVILALAARQHQIPVRIVALEHEPTYAAQTRALLERHGLSSIADVRDAPLAPTGLEGHDTPWHDPAALDGVEDIGLLFVDGPPEQTGPDARYPAVPLIRSRLAEKCLILMDDYRRPAEQRAADRWAELLPDFERSELPLQKGAGVFRRH